MRFWDKRAEKRELTDFAAVAEDLRKRRAASRESARLHRGPEVSADEVRSYEPEDHLVERRAQARRLVADSRHIPRLWDADEPLPGSWQSFRSTWPTMSVPPPAPKATALSPGFWILPTVIGTVAFIVSIWAGLDPGSALLDASIVLVGCCVLAVGTVTIVHFKNHPIVDGAAVLVALLILLGFLATLRLGGH